MMKFRKLLLTVLTLCVLAGGTIPGIARAADEVELECKVGYNNKVYMMNWMPVIVDVQAGSNDIDGDLVVFVNGRSGKPNEYRASVQLSANSKKRVTIYVMMEMLQKNFTIELVGKNNKVLAKQSVKNVQQGEGYVPLLGLLGTGEGLSSFLDINKQPEPAAEDLPKAAAPYISSTAVAVSSNKYQNFNLQPVSLNKETFPSRSEAIAGFGLIICNNNELGELDEKQTETLKNWIDKGGILLASTGPEAKARVAALNGIIGGISHSGTADVDVSDNFEQITGEPLASSAKLVAARLDGAGEVVYEVDGVPLAYKREIGRGAVVITAFDLALEPLSDYADLPGLIMGMLGAHVLNINQNAYYRDQDYVMMTAANALGNISEMRTPSLLIMALILLVYIVLAAPVTYVVLKRKDKREWMWLAVPVWAILITFSIYAYGFATKGTDYISNTVATLTIDEVESRSSANVFTGVFFPRRESVELGIETNKLVRPITENYNYYGQDDNEQKGRAETVMRQDGGNAALVLRDVSMWTMKSVYYQADAVQVNELKSDLHVEDGEIKGTITNTTGMRLENIGILSQSAFQVIEALEPGESAEISLMADVKGYYGSSYDLINAMFPYNYQGGRNQEDSVVSTRREFMYQWANSASSNSQDMLTLVCWTDEVEFPSVIVNGEKPLHQGTQTLMSVRLPVSLEYDGGFETMGSGIPFTMTESSGVNSAGYGGEMYATGGSNAKFAIDFSEYLEKYELETITVNWDYMYGSPWLRLYNYDTEEWEAASFPYPLTKESYYKDGVIRVMMEVPDGGDANFRMPSLALKGKVGGR